jgi:hypothetical protein
MKFLKFNSEQECITAFTPYMHEDDNGILQYPSWIGRCAIDVIGVMHRPTGVILVDSEGNEYPETQPIPGWHVNTMDELPEELEAYTIEVTTPQRTFGYGSI